jgi:hypothetical protein
MTTLATDCIITMTDDELCAYVSTHTALTTLPCKHCKGDVSIRARFPISLRRRLMKLAQPSGCVILSASMKFPKSCDKQTLMNDKTNRINNTFYPLLRKATKEGKVDEVAGLQKMRCELQCETNDIETHPYKYGVEEAPPPVKRTIKIRLRSLSEIKATQ